ncbi:Histone H1 [Orchesella cincta]|uniref:Histone H1 n=1 Tax=Orchesella cincta TaxID=48709 RepID=A0A1D2M1A0_ORCCI|nr:Histone H1 [Orchesella cincta]
MAEKSGVEKKGKGAKSTKSEPTSSSHPSSAALIKEAISKLNEKGGSSLYAIKKYISDVHKLDMEKRGNFIRKALKNAVEAGSLVQTKGTGASGSFKLAEKVKKQQRNPHTPKTKKTAAKKSEAEPKAKEAKSAKTTAAKNPTTVKPAAKKSQAKVKLPKTMKPTAAAAKPKTGSQKKAAPKKK